MKNVICQNIEIGIEYVAYKIRTKILDSATGTEFGICIYSG